MLIQNINGYHKFYVGDFLGAYNTKFGDIDISSPGNNTYLYVEAYSSILCIFSSFYII